MHNYNCLFPQPQPLSYKVCLTVGLDLLEGHPYTHNDYLAFLPRLQATYHQYPRKADLRFLLGAFYIKLNDIDMATHSVYQWMSEDQNCTLYMGLLGMIECQCHNPREALPFLCYARAKHHHPSPFFHILDQFTSMSFAQIPHDIDEKVVRTLYERVSPDLPFTPSRSDSLPLEDKHII
ncbi:MAG: hypothetical protein AAFR59_00510 [Bacteroidota bacterium]